MIPLRYDIIRVIVLKAEIWFGGEIGQYSSGADVCQFIFAYLDTGGLALFVIAVLKAGINQRGVIQ